MMISVLLFVESYLLDCVMIMKLCDHCGVCVCDHCGECVCVSCSAVCCVSAAQMTVVSIWTSPFSGSFSKYCCSPTACWELEGGQQGSAVSNLCVGCFDDHRKHENVSGCRMVSVCHLRWQWWFSVLFIQILFIRHHFTTIFVSWHWICRNAWEQTVINLFINWRDPTWTTVGTKLFLLEGKNFGQTPAVGGRSHLLWLVGFIEGERHRSSSRQRARESRIDKHYDDYCVCL